MAIDEVDVVPRAVRGFRLVLVGVLGIWLQARRDLRDFVNAHAHSQIHEQPEGLPRLPKHTGTVAARHHARERNESHSLDATTTSRLNPSRSRALLDGSRYDASVTFELRGND